jgi:hypothetical protein
VDDREQVLHGRRQIPRPHALLLGLDPARTPGPRAPVRLEQRRGTPPIRLRLGTR